MFSSKCQFFILRFIAVFIGSYSVFGGASLSYAEIKLQDQFITRSGVLDRKNVESFRKEKERVGQMMSNGDYQAVIASLKNARISSEDSIVVRGMNFSSAQFMDILSLIALSLAEEGRYQEATEVIDQLFTPLVEQHTKAEPKKNLWLDRVLANEAKINGDRKFFPDFKKDMAARIKAVQIDLGLLAEEPMPLSDDAIISPPPSDYLQGLVAYLSVLSEQGEVSRFERVLNELELLDGLVLDPEKYKDAQNEKQFRSFNKYRTTQALLWLAVAKVYAGKWQEAFDVAERRVVGFTGIVENMQIGSLSLKVKPWYRIAKTLMHLSEYPLAIKAANNISNNTLRLSVLVEIANEFPNKKRSEKLLASLVDEIERVNALDPKGYFYCKMARAYFKKGNSKQGRYFLDKAANVYMPKHEEVSRSAFTPRVIFQPYDLIVQTYIEYGEVEGALAAMKLSGYTKFPPYQRLESAALVAAQKGLYDKMEVLTDLYEMSFRDHLMKRFLDNGAFNSPYGYSEFIQYEGFYWRLALLLLLDGRDEEAQQYYDKALLVSKELVLYSPHHYPRSQYVRSYEGELKANAFLMNQINVLMVNELRNGRNSFSAAAKLDMQSYLVSNAYSLDDILAAAELLQEGKFYEEAKGVLLWEKNHSKKRRPEDWSAAATALARYGLYDEAEVLLRIPLVSSSYKYIPDTLSSMYRLKDQILAKVAIEAYKAGNIADLKIIKEHVGVKFYRLFVEALMSGENKPDPFKIEFQDLLEGASSERDLVEIFPYLAFLSLSAKERGKDATYLIEYAEVVLETIDDRHTFTDACLLLSSYFIESGELEKYQKYLVLARSSSGAASTLEHIKKLEALAGTVK